MTIYYRLNSHKIKLRLKLNKFHETHYNNELSFFSSLFCQNRNIFGPAPKLPVERIPKSVSEADVMFTTGSQFRNVKRRTGASSFELVSSPLSTIAPASVPRAPNLASTQRQIAPWSSALRRPWSPTRARALIVVPGSWRSVCCGRREYWYGFFEPELKQ